MTIIKQHDALPAWSLTLTESTGPDNIPYSVVLLSTDRRIRRSAHKAGLPLDGLGGYMTRRMAMLVFDNVVDAIQDESESGMARYIVQTLGQNGRWISLAGFIMNVPTEKMLKQAHVAKGEEYRIIDRKHDDKTVAFGWHS